MQKSYQVRLKFRNPPKNLCVFALPQTNQYQDIKELSVHPKPANLFFDEWGNTVAVFNKKTTLEFLYSPKSLKKSIDTHWKLGDYKKNKEILFFSKPNRFISGQDEKIIKLAKSIIKKRKCVFEIAKSLYDFALEYLSYGKPIEGLYPYSQALEEKVTDCGGFSTLLLSLLHSLKIPGRLVVGFLIKDSILKRSLSMLQVTGYRLQDLLIHAWLEILLPDKTWLPLDPSIEWRRKKGLSKRLGGFGFVPADRLVTSFGCDFKIKIDKKIYQIDLMQNPIYL